jgi:hypothetical protein
LDDGQEPAGEPVDFDDLEPDIQANLIQTILKQQEHDERPDSYDFFFSSGELSDGAEVGRYIRNDRGQMPDGLTARGNLRLVLLEPEVMERFRGSPAIQRTIRELPETVEQTCDFIDAGAQPSETADRTELSRRARLPSPAPPA